jgi:peroxiredoxin
MKRIVLIVLLLCGVLLVYAMTDTTAMKTAGGVASIGVQAPDFALQDLQGKMWRLSDLKGKVVLLHFWATWCSTCEQENPTLQNLMRAEQDNPQLIVLSVLVRDDPSAAKAYMAKKGFDFPVLADDKKTSIQYGLTGVPETFLIDKNGTIRDKVVGPNTWDSPAVREALAKFIRS